MPFEVSAPDSGRSTAILITPLFEVPPPPAVPQAASATLARANPASNFGNLIQRPPSMCCLDGSSLANSPCPKAELYVQHCPTGYKWVRLSTNSHGTRCLHMTGYP